MALLDVDGLPNVEPGQNPYRVYIRALNDAMYRDPTPGLRVRLLTLLSLNLFYLVLAIAYIILLVFESRKHARARLQTRRFWLFRLVQRPSGRYIVSNQRALCSIMSIIVGAVSIAYLSDVYNVYVDKGSQTNTSAWRAYIFLPLFAHGWIISWGGLQALILTTDHKHGPLMTARVANALFVGGGIILTAVGVVCGTFFMRAGDSLYNEYRQIVDPLRQLKYEWQGEISPDHAEMIANGYMAVVAKWRSYFKTGTWVYIIIGVLLPGSVLLINISSLNLTRIMQAHIDAKKEHLSGLPNTTDPESGIVTISSPFTSDESSVSEIATTSPKRPLRNQEVRALATKASGLLRDHALQVLALQKAKKDLALISTSVGLISLILMGYVVIIGIMCATGRFMTGYWSLWEACILGFEWLYCCVNVAAHLALFFVATRHRAANAMTTVPTESEPEHLAETLMMRNATSMGRLQTPAIRQTAAFEGPTMERRPRPVPLEGGKFKLSSTGSNAETASHAASPTSLTFSDMLERCPSPSMTYAREGQSPVSRPGGWWHAPWRHDPRRSSHSSLEIRVGIETDIVMDREEDTEGAKQVQA
ncbi:hypothetical protein OIO90_001583 [Microbotryomycetes sp. JL221]|nr:hypothetical protein OIO90_001583 [Microbotryomycetes sp. JL221]